MLDTVILITQVFLLSMLVVGLGCFSLFLMFSLVDCLFWVTDSFRAILEKHNK